MLLDVTSPGAAGAYRDMYSGCLVIAPKLVLITTWYDSGVWGQRLTHTWTANPMNTAEKIRCRPSREGPRVYAQIAATAAQIAAAKTRGGHAAVAGFPARPLTLQATVHISLGMEGAIDAWLPAVMGVSGLPALRRS